MAAATRHLRRWRRAPACVAFVDHYVQCIPEAMQYAQQIAYYCASDLMYAQMAGGPCGNAIEEFYACMSMVDCQQLSDPTAIRATAPTWRWSAADSDRRGAGARVTCRAPAAARGRRRAPAAWASIAAGRDPPGLHRRRRHARGPRR
ncbi:MAG: hypothetical protein U0168_21990 [Nannocystaceae bacterium]